MLKLAKNQANASNLNFCYLKIIDILHQGYNPKTIGHILKDKQKRQVCLFSWDYTINLNENEDETEK